MAYEQNRALAEVDEHCRSHWQVMVMAYFAKAVMKEQVARGEC